MSKLLNFTNLQIVDRARSCVKDIVKYRLPYPNGGSDPTTTKPYSVVNISGTNINVCDCIGFAMWCCGISRRFQGLPMVPPFPDTPSVAGSYINCSSLVEEALGFDRRRGQTRYPGGRFFKIVEVPVPGDLIVYPGKTVSPNNPPHGHIGVIVSIPTGEEAPKNASVDLWITKDKSKVKSPLRIIHCSASNYRHRGRAVYETDASVWKDRGAYFVHFNREELLRGAV